MISSRKDELEGFKEENIKDKSEIGNVINKILTELRESEKKIIEEGYIIDDYNLNVTFFEHDYISFEHHFINLTYLELINRLYIDSYRAHFNDYDISFVVFAKGHKLSKPITNHIKNKY